MRVEARAGRDIRVVYKYVSGFSPHATAFRETPDFYLLKIIQLDLFSGLKLIPRFVRSFNGARLRAREEREAEHEQEPEDDREGHKEGAGPVLELRNEVRGGHE